MNVNAVFSRRSVLVAGASLSLVFCAAIPGAWAQRKVQPPSQDQVQKVLDALPEKATATPAEPRKVLIFWKCNGFFHGCIPLANEALKLLGEETGAYTAVVSQDMAMFDPGKLDQFDAVIFNNTTRLKFEKPEHRNTLMDFVKGGKGVVGIHAATDNFYEWAEAAEMMGGLFHGHPWGGGGTWAVKIDDPKHVLNKAFGGKGFLIKDEIYKFRDPYSRDIQRILLSLDMTKKRNKPGRPDGDNAIAWCKTYGKGRVFYCSLGHNNEIFWNPAVLQHYLDGIQFALGDLEADTTPSAKLTKQPEPALCPEE